MKETIETFAKLTGLFSASALILSIFHEVGFFHVIGGEYRQLLTLSDYLVSAISWLPESAYFLFVGGILCLIVWKNSFNFMHRYPDVPLPRDRTVSGWINNIFYFGTLFIAAFGTIVGPPSLFLETQPMLVWVVFYLWLVTCAYMVKKISFVEELPNSARFLLLFIPVLVSNSYLSGVYEAYRAFFRPPNVYTIERSAQPEVQPKHVVLLRSLDKGALVLDKIDSTVYLIRWDRISSISHKSSPRNNSILCNITGYLCDLPPEP